MDELKEILNEKPEYNKPAIDADNYYFDRITIMIVNSLGWKSDKIKLWFTVKNPLLGNETPYNMIKVRKRYIKLEKFVIALLSENERDQNGIR